MGLRLIAIACLVGAAFAGPFQRESLLQCASSCSRPSIERFNYEPGQKYTYDYRGVNYLNIAGQRKQRALITGRAEIHVHSKCDMVLVLRNIRIEQKASQQETSKLQRELEVPMPFAFDDGKVDHLCPSQLESTLSQNVKKGILSSIINTMSQFNTPEDVKEVDSLGTCLTKYEVKSGRNIIVQKSKDLKSCTNRHTSVTSLITNPYDSEDSDIHTLPIFPEERLVCEQEIVNKVIKNVKCKELATLKPFTQQDSIIEFEGEVELRLRSVSQSEGLESEIHSSQVKDSILYNLEDEHSTENYEKNVEDLLKNMCEKNRGIIDATISRDFFELVSLSKRLSYNSLEKIYRSLENGHICSSKKIMDVFVDALPMAGNEGSIKLMVKLLVDKKIVGVKAKLWTVSLAFIRKPTDKTLAAVSDLLQKDRSASVLLGVSAMVSRYCQQHQCEKSQAVKQIVSELSHGIGRQCSFDDEKEVIAILKAFGNMGYLGEAESTILSCTKSNVQSIQVRLAAIDSFRRTEKRRPRELLSLYSNYREHFEVRIAALSSIIKNADMQQIQIIQKVAEAEKHEQVAAYASTLIASIKKSSSPSKKTVRNLLHNVEFNMPSNSYWNNSKNIELSVFSEPLNVGGGFEADLIHKPHSIVPRSIYTRFDVDVFGTRMNMFEMGVRAEGLEELMKNVISLKPSLKVEGGLQASVFMRSMGIEFFELSASDLTSLKKMVEVADVMRQISQERKADFSHSFLFMNSKLVIPSVTGRSYSFGLTGSATLGLTASSKVDVLNLLSAPRSGDIHGYFKPSCNVEMTATIGMHSSTGRPDMKIVTVLHSESDIEARFQVKSGHLALASINMPSENVVVAKLSSNVIEIEADQSEKPAFGVMYKKLDRCISQLEKPLGLSVCGKWEVPRPFFDKKFPYVRGIGNIEINIKKSDPQMRGYELRAEIPKQETDVMKYQIAFDTPNSRVSRRFSGDLEVRKADQGKKEFSLDLKCPFQSATAKGSYTLRNDLIEGQVEMLCGSKRATLSASTEVTDSATQKIWKPSVEISLPSSQPIRVGGTVALTKGRKQQVTIDIRSNTPQRRPLSIKGTLMKEGPLSLQKEAEWKLSSDLAVKTPIINTQIKSLIEKQSKQSQTLSSNIKIDYQCEKSQQHTIRFVEKFQQSASKISSSAELEMSQFPSAKFNLNWNMQGRSKESLKNDITLKYGQNPERTYISILQSSQMPQNGRGECRLSVKAPQFDVDSELRVAHELQKYSKLFVEADLRYQQEKHIKGLLNLERPSVRPLRMKVKAEVELPSARKLTYEDEIQETSRNTYEGNSIIQWRSDKKAELKYKYQKQGDYSSMKHDLETILRLPSRQSAIKSKITFQKSKESVGIEGRLNLNRATEYFVKTHLNKKGSSHLTVKVPKVEGNVRVIREAARTSLTMDAKMNFLRRPRHIIASSELIQGNNKKYEVSVQWDADRNPNQKLAFLTQIELDRRGYKTATKLQVTEIVNIEVAASGDKTLMGRHEASMDATVLKFQPIGFHVQHEMSQESIKSLLRMSRSHSDKLEILGEGRLTKRSNEVQLSTIGSVKALDNSFESKEWSLHGSLSQSESSLTMKNHVRLQWATNKIYESEFNYDLRPNLLVVKAFLHTPHIQFEKQAIGFSHRRSQNIIATSATMELLNGKVVSVSSEIKTQKKHFSYTVTMSSPFEAMKDAAIHFSIDNESSPKHLLSYYDFNGVRKVNVEGKMVTQGKHYEIEGRVKSVWYNEVSAHIIAERNPQSFKYEANIMRGSSNLFSTVASRQTSNNDQLYSLNANYLEKNLVDVKLSKQVRQELTRHQFEAKGPFSPIEVTLQTTQNEKDSIQFVLKTCYETRSKQCYHIKGVHKGSLSSPNVHFYKKLSLDIEKSLGESKPEPISNVVLVLSLGKYDYREKIMVTYKGQTYGHEIRAHLKEHEKDTCHLDAHIFMARRTIRVRSSLLHHSEDLMMDLEVFPDASVPSRKFGLELKKQINPRTREITGHISMIYPGMEKPLELSGQVQREGFLPVKGKIELHYSPSSYNKALILEIIPEVEGRQAEKKSYLYKLYLEDQKLDLSVKLIQRRTRTQDVYGYEYRFKTVHGEETGSVSVMLSEKMNGIPTTLELSFNSNDYDVKARGHYVWTTTYPSLLELTLMTKGQTVYGASLKAQDSCIVFEESLKQGSFWKTNLCVDKREQDVIKFINVESFYKGHKCLDFSVNVNKGQRNLANIVMDWEKEDFIKAWDDLKELETVILTSPIGDLVKELKKDIKEVLQTLKPIYEEIKRRFSQIIREHSRLLKDIRNQDLIALPYSFWNIIQHLMPLEFVRNEVVKPVIGMTMCMAHKYVQYAYNHMPEVIRAFWIETKAQFESCLRQVCKPGTFCYAFVETYQREGWGKCAELLQQKAQQMKVKIQNQYPQIQRQLTAIQDAIAFPDFSAYWRKFIDFVENTMERIYNYFKSIWDIKDVFPEYVHLVVEKFAVQFNKYWSIISETMKEYIHPGCWFKNMIKFFEEKWSQFFDRFSNGPLYHRLKSQYEHLEKQARVHLLQAIDKLAEELNKIIERSESAEEFRMIKQLLQQIREWAQHTWENKEAIIQKSLANVRQTVLEDYPKKWIQDKFTVQKFDPKQGNIEIQVHYPSQSKYVQILSNAMRAIKSKTMNDQ